MVGHKRPQFVLFGSSIVQYSFSHGGWGALLADIYSRKADIILRGYNGWNSRRALEVLHEVFSKSMSDTIRIIFLGFPPINEDQMRATLSEFPWRLPRTNELCRRYSESCVNLCKEMNIEAIDLLTSLQKRVDWLDVCFTDGIHLSAEGSKMVVKEILKVLKETKWEPSLHWKSMLTEFSMDSPYNIVASDRKTTLNTSEWTIFMETQLD